MLFYYYRDISDLCSCQKSINDNANNRRYPIIPPQCSYCREKTKPFQMRTSVMVKNSQHLTPKDPLKKGRDLLYQLLSVLIREEDVNSIVMQGKRWVFLPRLNLSQQLHCTHEEIQMALDILLQEGYIESLNPSSADVEEAPFFRVNRKKYRHLSVSSFFTNKQTTS